MWHRTHDWWWTLCQTFRFLALMVWNLWCTEDLEEKDRWVYQFWGVCRTALATPGLLKTHTIEGAQHVTIPSNIYDSKSGMRGSSPLCEWDRPESGHCLAETVHTESRKVGQWACSSGKKMYPWPYFFYLIYVNENIFEQGEWQFVDGPIAVSRHVLSFRPGNGNLSLISLWIYSLVSLLYPNSKFQISG